MLREALMRICSGPGCYAKVPEDVRFCDECKPDSKPERERVKRSTSDPILQEYWTTRWQKLRAKAKQMHPFCAGFRGECNELSRVVDHNIPARLMSKVCKALGLFPLERFPGFYLLPNLVGLCHRCHNKKSLVEDGMDWSAALVLLLSNYLTKELTQAERRERIMQALSH